MQTLLSSPLVIVSGVCLVVLCLILLRRVWRKAGTPVVIDGSNVMHWDGEVAKLTTVRAVIAELQRQGYEPGIVFDANAGYKLEGRYLDDRHFAKRLKLPADRVLVVPKGEPADPTILAAARDVGGRVVTNDRFRDWAGEFPEVAEPGHLVRGGVKDGAVWLEGGVKRGGDLVDR